MPAKKPDPRASAPQTDSERNLAAAIASGSKVVQTVGIAVGQHHAKGAMSAKIETAMKSALEAAQAEGVTDAATLRTRMMAAREAALRG